MNSPAAQGVEMAGGKEPGAPARLSEESPHLTQQGGAH